MEVKLSPPLCVHDARKLLSRILNSSTEGLSWGFDFVSYRSNVTPPFHESQTELFDLLIPRSSYRHLYLLKICVFYFKQFSIWRIVKEIRQKVISDSVHYDICTSIGFSATSEHQDSAACNVAKNTCGTECTPNRTAFHCFSYHLMQTFIFVSCCNLFFIVFSYNFQHTMNKCLEALKDKYQLGGY
jgi:hypothetical protein